jgi:acetate kinase
MKATEAYVLTINAGSSSIKFALYQIGEPLQQRLHGQVDHIGQETAHLSAHGRINRQQIDVSLQLNIRQSVAQTLIEWLEQQEAFTFVTTVGHRIVHGRQHWQAEIIQPALLNDLQRIAMYDPDHMPEALALINTLSQHQPKLLQVACFDTAFHHTLPRVAKLLAIPRRYAAKGIQRYGFHGLSFAYLMKELARTAGTEAASGRVILAHLGSGASVAAVFKGQSIDTTMCFSPTAGLPMATRSGDLDPAIALYLQKTEGLTAQQFSNMVNHESGLLGISETSGDIQALLSQESQDIRAAEAVAYFCYQTKKYLGAYAAALGGLDTLVFSGGIGENQATIRARICEGLGFLNIEVDEARNNAHATIISTDNPHTTVRVIRTDEQWMIAHLAYQLMKSTTTGTTT